MSDRNESLRVAIIDSDSGFIQVLGNRIESAGWRLRKFSTQVPSQELVAMKLNVVVIDINRIGDDAWAYLDSITGLLPDLGVVVVTDPVGVAQRVRGLRIGADDWINKPCHPEEVIARIEAVARRRRRPLTSRRSGPLVFGEIEIRPDQFQAFVAGQSLDLTRREFELLHLLCESDGRVLERDAIYQRVWGYAMAHGDRSVDVFIRKVRQKLERNSPGWSYIHTHFGVGYRFAAETPVPEEHVLETRAARTRPPSRKPQKRSEKAAVSLVSLPDPEPLE